MRIARYLLWLLLAPLLAAAQDFPSKPVRLIVPSAAGGLTDGLGRAMAPELSRIWGRQMFVENRPGANQIIAAETLAKSAPDGHHMLIVDRAFLVLNPLLYAKLPYDAERDFAPVLNLAQVSNVLISHPGLPAKSLAELVALAKARPGDINYASFGRGSTSHVDTEAFSSRADIKLNHIPYKGVAEVLLAVTSGQVQVALAGMPVVRPLVRDGRVRLLAIGSAQRSPLLPEVPTFAEEGFPGYESQSWIGLFVPAGTPRPIIERIATDVGRVITEKEFSERFLAGVGLELRNQGPDAFARIIAADRLRYADYVRAINMKLD